MTPELREQRRRAFTQHSRGRPKGSTRETSLLTKRTRFEFVLATALQAVGKMPPARAEDLAIILASGRPVKAWKSGRKVVVSLEYCGLEDRREYLAAFSRKVGSGQGLTKEEIGWITQSFLWLTKLFTAIANNKDCSLFISMLQGLGWTPIIGNIVNLCTQKQ